MEGRAGEGAVLLLDHNDIDCAAEGGRVDAVPRSRDTGAEATDVVHGYAAAVGAGGFTCKRVEWRRVEERTWGVRMCRQPRLFGRQASGW